MDQNGLWALFPGTLKTFKTTSFPVVQVFQCVWYNSYRPLASQSQLYHAYNLVWMQSFVSFIITGNEYYDSEKGYQRCWLISIVSLDKVELLSCWVHIMNYISCCGYYFHCSLVAILITNQVNLVTYYWLNHCRSQDILLLH